MKNVEFGLTLVDKALSFYTKEAGKQPEAALRLSLRRVEVLRELAGPIRSEADVEFALETGMPDLLGGDWEDVGAPAPRDGGAPGDMLTQWSWSPTPAGAHAVVEEPAAPPRRNRRPKRLAAGGSVGGRDGPEISSYRYTYDDVLQAYERALQIHRDYGRDRSMSDIHCSHVNYLVQLLNAGRVELKQVYEVGRTWSSSWKQVDEHEVVLTLGSRVALFVMKRRSCNVCSREDLSATNVPIFVDLSATSTIIIFINDKFSRPSPKSTRGPSLTALVFRNSPEAIDHPFLQNSPDQAIDQHSATLQKINQHSGKEAFAKVVLCLAFRRDMIRARMLLEEGEELDATARRHHADMLDLGYQIVDSFEERDAELLKAAQNRGLLNFTYVEVAR